MVLKRNFLVAICDDELSKIRKSKRGYMDPLRLKFNKKEKAVSSGIEFLEDIKNLFLTFGINCSSIKINNDKYISSDNEISRSIYFNVSAKRQNLLRFVNQIGSKIKGGRFVL